VCIVEGSQSPEENAAQRTRELAAILYPLETWLQLEERIFTAASRQPRSKNQELVLKKELVQARILTAQGSTVYLLPEVVDPANIGIKYPDAVVDGYVMEFKTITGNVREIERRFKESREKADRVFFKIDAPLTHHEVTRKLSGIITRKAYCGGVIIAYFTETAELCYWNVDDLG
jgi:hypothetical protein